MGKKRYKQRIGKITVRSRDDPAEYARQYYWVVIKGKKKAPVKQKNRGRRKKKK